MGIKRTPWTEAYIAARIRKGRGQGEGPEYQPWITVQDFSSRGTQSRIPSALLGRAVHVMSYLERRMFLLHEFKLGLLDYREQYPIPREVSLAAAKALKVRHPVYPKTSIPVVMTLDALVWRQDDENALVPRAWDAKPQSELERPRALAKLAIHRASCEIMGIGHEVFTDQSVSTVLMRNIEWLRISSFRQGESVEDLRQQEYHQAAVLRDLFERRPRKTIREYCQAYDRAGSHPSGTALRTIKQLIYDHQLSVDLEAKDVTALRLPVPDSPLLRRTRGGY